MKVFQSIVHRHPTIPVIHQELLKIKWLLDKQSEFFGNGNPNLDNRFSELLRQTTPPPVQNSSKKSSIG